MKIYTKQGDKGQTSLFDGTRVAKDHLRIETYGTVDELNSAIGVAMAHCKDAALRELLAGLQVELFSLGSDLATPADSKNRGKVSAIGPGHVAGLEKQIDAATAELPPLKRFILPGGSVAAAQLHLARTICRRAERLLVTLMQRDASLTDDALIYLNRMSDLLFTLARLANKRENHPDVEWNPRSSP